MKQLGKGCAGILLVFVLFSCISAMFNPTPPASTSSNVQSVGFTTNQGAHTNTSAKEQPAATSKPENDSSALVTSAQTPPQPKPSPAIEPTTLPSPTPLAFVAQVTTNANLRSYPSTTTSKVIDTIAAGSTLTLTSKTPDGAWYEVTTASGTQGYVSATLLTIAPEITTAVQSRDAGPPPVAAQPVAKPASRSAQQPTAAPATTGGTRVGAICRDGTRSSATGRGACSHHGGVDHWLYR